MRRHLHLQVRKDNSAGSSPVWVALTMIVMLGFAGWAVDFAVRDDDRANVQRLPTRPRSPAHVAPDDPAGAIAAAKHRVSKNSYTVGVR